MLHRPLAVAFAVVALAAAAPAGALPAGFSVQTVTPLQFGTSIAFAPDGRIFVNERGGRVRILRDGRLLPQPFATVPTRTDGENGLFGIALHPHFPTEPWVYVFFTKADNSANTVVRIRAEGDTGGERQTILDGMPAGSYHNGGMVEFGPDGMLYVSNGEGHSGGRAQDPKVLGGKIYRLTPEGRIPPDNPFGADSPAYAVGLRNVFGMAWDPVSGVLFASDNGPSGGDGPSCCDELDRVVPGGNYGWPRFRCDQDPLPGMIQAIRCYRQTVVPTGVAFGPQPFPEPYRASLYLGTFRGAVRRITLSADRTAVAADEVFVSESAVGLEAGPDGLYYTTPDALKRVVFTAPPPAPTASPAPARTPSPPPTTTPLPSPPTTPLAAPPVRTRPAPWPWVGGALGGLALASGAGLWLVRLRRR